MDGLFENRSRSRLIFEERTFDGEASRKRVSRQTCQGAHMKTACIGLAAFFAASAMAQTPPASPNPPPSTPTTTTPAPQPQSTPPHTGTSGQRDPQMPTGARNATAMPFDTLDTNHAGYLMREQLKSNGWLAQHFTQCDTDSDMRVTRSEYTMCTQAPRR
jgi:hypothetical protein